MLELLNNLFDTGMFDKMVRAGIISSKYATYRSIYFYVDAQQKARGIGKEKAVTEAAVVFRVGRTTIYKALDLMQTPVN